MPYFVIVFDRRKGRLEQLERFEDSAVDQAFGSCMRHQKRLMSERDKWDVILFQSPSYEALKRTHGIFFPLRSN